MNTSKDNFEGQIKKQIGEREMAPSRDLWSEIEWQTGNSTPSKSRVNWLLIAACLILTFSLGTVLFFLKETPSSEHPKMAKEGNKPGEDRMTVKSNDENVQLAIQNTTREDAKSSSSQERKEKIAIPVPDKNTIITQNALPEKKPELIRISDPKILAKADTLNIPVKKKKYVDPSTLLFSVEHKDVIEKTKDGSNVATIELNRN